MKLFFYYALHSLKNQIKKLCRTWFVVFILCCLVFGVLIGLGAGMLASHFEDEGPAEDEVVTDELLPDEVVEMPDEETVKTIADMAVSGVILLMFLFHFYSSDKSGNAIFTMSDVNFLFAAPMKPQSVLLFKLMSQILLALFAGFYFVFQIPNLIINLGFSLPAALSLLVVWVLCIVYGKLIQVLCYTLASTHERLKKLIRPIVYAFVAALCVVFFFCYRQSGSVFSALGMLLAFKGSRYIPIYGTMKGIFLWSLEGNYLAACLAFVLLLTVIPLFVYLIWRIKADFYEDAMAKSQETAEILRAAQSGQTAKRKKDRSDKLRRDGLNHGSGANVFFFKAIYNRNRFAHLGVFTKTAETYFVVALSVTLLQLLAIHTQNFFVIGCILCVMVFFRSLGNPMAKDMEKDYFVTLPAPAHAKVFWSLLAGGLECFLDVLPAMLVAAVCLRANPLTLLLFLLLAVAIDFYAGNVMLFIELSLPTSLALQVKQLISIMFIYFGLIPIAVMVVAGILLKQLMLFAFFAALIALAIGAVFFAFSPMFLEKGRK